MSYTPYIPDLKEPFGEAFKEVLLEKYNNNEEIYSMKVIYGEVCSHLEDKIGYVEYETRNIDERLRRRLNSNSIQPYINYFNICSRGNLNTKNKEEELLFLRVNFSHAYEYVVSPTPEEHYKAIAYPQKPIKRYEFSLYVFPVLWILFCAPLWIASFFKRNQSENAKNSLKRDDYGLNEASIKHILLTCNSLAIILYNDYGPYYVPTLLLFTLSGVCSYLLQIDWSYSSVKKAFFADYKQFKNSPDFKSFQLSHFICLASVTGALISQFNLLLANIVLFVSAFICLIVASFSGVNFKSLNANNKNTINIIHELIKKGRSIII